MAGGGEVLFLAVVAGVALVLGVVLLAARGVRFARGRWRRPVAGCRNCGYALGPDAVREDLLAWCSEKCRSTWVGWWLIQKEG